MKKMRIKKLPAIAIANFMAALRVTWLVFSGFFDDLYFSAMFGPRAELANNDATSSPAILLYKYVIPVVLVWIVGFLVCRAFNVLARTNKIGLTLETDE